jgi:hypothetical protein
MRRMLKLRLSAFGRESIGAFAEQHHLSLDEVVRGATLYYISLSDAARDGMALQPPPSPSPLDPHPNGQLEVTLDVNASELRKLETECERHGVPLTRLVEHAVILFLADLDSGVAMLRLVERAREPRRG